LDPPGLKLVSKLNNKIVVQNDDKFNLFTLKNDNDSSRFIDKLSELFIEQKRFDCFGFFHACNLD
jgi:tricorn protease-like protein